MQSEQQAYILEQLAILKHDNLDLKAKFDALTKPDEYISNEEARAIYQVAKGYWPEYRLLHKVPCYKIGKILLYKRNEINEHINTFKTQYP